jgi:hypothetical protein
MCVSFFNLDFYGINVVSERMSKHMALTLLSPLYTHHESFLISTKTKASIGDESRSPVVAPWAVQELRTFLF